MFLNWGLRKTGDFCLTARWRKVKRPGRREKREGRMEVRGEERERQRPRPSGRVREREESYASALAKTHEGIKS